jgi:hypothetical protein
VGFSRCFRSAALSDAIQFLMERDRTSPENRSKPAKNAAFCESGENPWHFTPRVATQKS